MKQKLKQSKGITLVSLVVTIIVLIILAGISLALIFGENGIVGRAKEAKIVTSVATAQEKLELIKSKILLDKFEITLDDYLEELEKVKEEYQVDDIEKIDDKTAEIIVDGKYKFTITDEKNGNLKTDYKGEAGGIELSAISGIYVYPTTGTFEVVKNVSGGELSVKSENENIAKATISGTTVTVIPQNVAGTVKIIVTSSAKGEYAEQKAVYKATVENGTITLSADAYTGTYDGNDHDAVSNVKVIPTDATVEYSIDGGAFSSTIPKVNGANTYSVSIRASKAGYATKTITKTITIGKNTQTGNLTLSASSGTITYPTAGTFTVTKNTSGGTLSVTSSDTSVATATISGTTVIITPKAISADGKQTTITVTSAATSNYEKQTQTYIATVNRGTISLDATAYTGSYDGSDHDAVSNVKVTPTDATVEYSIDGGTFSTSIPKVNGANTYSVSIRASKAGYATKTITKTVTIGKNTQTGNLTLSATSGTITYPTAGTFTVTKNTSGGTLSVTSSDTSVATASINGTTVTITPKAISADGKKTTITVTSAATSNYEKQTQTYTATVNRGTISLDATAYTGSYDGSDHDAVSNVKVTPTDATVEYSIDGGTFSTSIPKVNGANTYSVSIRASKAGYATKTITKTVTIGKNTQTGNLTLSATSGTITYPTAGTFTVTKNTSGGTLSVTSSDTSVATASINGTTVTITPKAISADGKKTTITVTSAATSNYEKQTQTYTATVNRGTISLDATAYTGNYDGSDHDAVSNVKVTPTDATVEYSIDGGAFSSTIPKVNGANTYSVSIRASKAGYATKTITKTVTIGKNTQTGNLALSVTSGTITYPTAGTFTVTKNASGGALSVTSSDTNVATATISGTTVTITPKAISADGKQTTITVTSAATSNYEKQTKTYTATVNRGTITLDATAYTGSYDGSDHDAVSNVKVTPTDATVEYSIDGGAFSTTIPKVNGANTYSVSIRASKAGHATKTITKTVTVGKNTQTGNLTLSASSGTITYPTAGTFTVTKNTSGGALSVTSSDTSVATVAISGTTVTITPKAISADGKQTTITVTSAATSNYEKQTQTYTATVNRGTITLSADAYTGFYNGNEHDAVSNVKVTPTDATVEYLINGGTFSTTIPKVTNLGTYSVSIKASKTGYVTKTITKTITLQKSEIEKSRDAGTYMTAPTTLKDSEGNLIKIPQGFKIASDSGINVTEGIVIEDNDIIDGIGNNRGNQYVWIPVGTGIKKADGTTVDIILGRYEFRPIIALKQNAENYADEVIIDSFCKELATSRIGVASSGTNGLNTTALNLKGFVDSVKTNGGYYIARYEASYGTDGKANSKVSNSFIKDYNTAPTTEGTLWNNITQIDAATASRNLYTTTTSDLINSYAWDTAIIYINNFSGIHYSNKNGPSINSSLTNTGANGDEVCKINDMASNTFEWTTEYHTNNTFTPRGSAYNLKSYMMTDRVNFMGIYRGVPFCTFRSILYM